MGDKFLVIGSNSFSGASFVTWLLDNTSADKIVGVSRSNEPNSSFLPYKNISRYKDRFNFHRVDLNLDTGSIVDIIQDVMPNYVVNFAAQGMVAESWYNPDQWIRTNVTSLAALLHEIYRFDFIDCFLQASTPEVYGANYNMTESNCYSPSTPYASSKAAADLLLNAYYQTHKFPARFTRAANIYGPSQQLYRIIPKTIIKILNNELLPLHGGGKSIRSFIHINDVSSATYSILKGGRDGEIYHLSGKQQISIRDLVSSICSLMGVQMDSLVYNVDQRTGTDLKYYLNSDKIKGELGWEPLISLNDGLSETIRWVIDNYSYLVNVSTEYLHKE